MYSLWLCACCTTSRGSTECFYKLVVFANVGSNNTANLVTGVPNGGSGEGKDSLPIDHIKEIFCSKVPFCVQGMSVCKCH